MKYVLDTDACIFALKGVRGLPEALKRRDPDDLAVTAVTLAELWCGAKKSRQPARTRRFQDAFLAPLSALPFDVAAAEHYAGIRARLEAQGTPIGERDQMIASIVRSLGLILVTHNVGEFSRVPDLSVEDWTS